MAAPYSVTLGQEAVGQALHRHGVLGIEFQGPLVAGASLREAVQALQNVAVPPGHMGIGSAYRSDNRRYVNSAELAERD